MLFCVLMHVASKCAEEMFPLAAVVEIVEIIFICSGHLFVKDLVGP